VKGKHMNGNLGNSSGRTSFSEFQSIATVYLHASLEKCKCLDVPSGDG
jgi:hypothetical protein